MKVWLRVWARAFGFLAVSQLVRGFGFRFSEGLWSWGGGRRLVLGFGLLSLSGFVCPVSLVSVSLCACGSIGLSIRETFDDILDP